MRNSARARGAFSLGRVIRQKIFQLESPGMRDLLVKITPNRFEDLIAIVALYRPGPMGSGMIEEFIKRKKGKIPVKYDLPQLREILDETYGVILYQEQVMSIANKLANFTQVLLFTPCALITIGASLLAAVTSSVR